MNGRGLRHVRWLYFGLGIKRWLIVAFVGIVLTVNGLSRWLTSQGIVIPINEHLDAAVDDFFSPIWLAPLFFFGGCLLTIVGLRRWIQAIVEAIVPTGRESVIDALLERRRRNEYKIVAIGGGTGLSSLLRGLKRSTNRITAVVTVSDDGGSSGRLRNELGVLPPGDIRNCLVALADDEALVTSLFQHRFSEGEGLVGHSFGNLFLAAMTAVTGNFDEAVRESSRVLNIIGRVLPATLSRVTLGAYLVDGRRIEGETTISHATSRIDRLFLEPSDVRPLPEVVEAIRDADAIVLGPGSLYTSILPNLLVKEIVEAIIASDALKIYICNVMTQPGETEGFTASDHVAALQRATSRQICDVVVVNDQPPTRLLERYAQEHQEPVTVDAAALAALGVRVKTASVVSETAIVRHDSDRVAAVVIGLIEERIRARAAYLRTVHGPSMPVKNNSEDHDDSR